MGVRINDQNAGELFCALVVIKQAADTAADDAAKFCMGAGGDTDSAELLEKLGEIKKSLLYIGGLINEVR